MKRNIVKVLFLCAVLCGVAGCQGKIDRKEVVRRNNPKLTAVDPWAPLTVGNGKFAFTADVTGLQTFPDFYFSSGIPLETEASWAWHSFPNPHNYRLEDAFENYGFHGRTVALPTNQNSPAGQWLRKNPHRLPLAQIGFTLQKDDGSAASPDDLDSIRQTLDLWSGTITSYFELGGEPVRVETVCHPELDMIAVKIESALLSEGLAKIAIRFPYTHDLRTKNKPPIDWNAERHQTCVLVWDSGRVDLQRVLDSTRLYVSIAWSKGGKLERLSNHRFVLSSTRDRLEFSCAFSPERIAGVLPSFHETRSASAHEWRAYWARGGMIDFSRCTDKRARELERRVILSLYLMRTQCVAFYPPQETGLTHLSWYGKHHTEMFWWHAAHFALWGRPELLEKGMAWYRSTLPQARETARQWGCEGARWSKMVGPEGRESPGNNPLIIWNQPHPIYLSELLYRLSPTRETLERYRELVFESARFMSSYVHWEAERNRYVLGPPLWISQEIYDPRESQNPAFELEYWFFALQLAQKWRDRLGLERDSKWDHILRHLSSLPVKDGLYVAMESIPDTWDNPASRQDHPTVLAPLGFLPGQRVDREIMRATLHKVLESWNWEAKIWGWDYPMIAMTAARLDEPELAIDVLLMDAPNNHYTASGHCPQRQDLAVYLPANGALLSAVALMAAGWDGAPRKGNPGFPQNGKWDVRWEDLHPLP